MFWRNLFEEGDDLPGVLPYVFRGGARGAALAPALAPAGRAAQQERVPAFRAAFAQRRRWVGLAAKMHGIRREDA